MRGSIDVAIYNGNHAVAIARQSQTTNKTIKSKLGPDLKSKLVDKQLYQNLTQIQKKKKTIDTSANQNQTKN